MFKRKFPKKTLIYLSICIAILALIIFQPISVLAAEGDTNAFKNFLSIIATYLRAAIIMAAAFTSAMGGFLYATSGGDPKKIGKAKEYFYSAITALIALVIAFLFFK